MAKLSIFEKYLRDKRSSHKPPKKPNLKSPASALARPAKAQILPQAERDYRGTPVITPAMAREVDTIHNPYRPLLRGPEELGAPLGGLSHLEEMVRQLHKVTTEIDIVMLGSPEIALEPQRQRQVWTGQVQELAVAAENDYLAGKHKNVTQAFVQATQEWESPKGRKKFTVHILREALRQYKKKLDGDL